jgi:hypothetical protein
MKCNNHAKTQQFNEPSKCSNHAKTQQLNKPSKCTNPTKTQQLNNASNLINPTNALTQQVLNDKLPFLLKCIKSDKLSTNYFVCVFTEVLKTYHDKL